MQSCDALFFFRIVPVVVYADWMLPRGCVPCIADTLPNPSVKKHEFRSNEYVHLTDYAMPYLYWRLERLIRALFACRVAPCYFLLSPPPFTLL